MLIFHQEALFSAAMATSKTTIDLDQAQDGPSLNRDTSLHHHDVVGGSFMCQGGWIKVTSLLPLFRRDRAGAGVRHPVTALSDS